MVERNQKLYIAIGKMQASIIRAQPVFKFLHGLYSGSHSAVVRHGQRPTQMQSSEQISECGRSRRLLDPIGDIPSA
jgi:hypothetical protein